MNRTGRWAPSPTGELHLGNLRTALLAWLFARSQGAEFLLRVEDLDRGRSRERFVGSQATDLRALGLEWDRELPRQSTRELVYEAALDALAADGLIYECFCTRSEVREAASAPHGELPEGAYPGTCRELTEAERVERRSERPAALRVRAAGERVRFADRLHGTIEGTVDDFVVRRNDGTHGYNLAVAVDDAEQGIGEVVRGQRPAHLDPAADLAAAPPRPRRGRFVGARSARPRPRRQATREAARGGDAGRAPGAWPDARGSARRARCLTRLVAHWQAGERRRAARTVRPGGGAPR